MHPVRENFYCFLGLLWIIRHQVYPEIVFAAHVTMHHELHGQRGLFTRIEDHRTDGRCRRSTSLNHFDIGLLGKTQWLIADVGYLELGLDGLPQRDSPEINVFLIDLQSRSAGD